MDAVPSVARAIVIAVALSFLSHSPSLAAPPVEAFGELPKASTGALSPDGKHMAIVEPLDGKNTVVIYDLTSPDSKPVPVRVQDAVAVKATWANNNNVICTYRANYREKHSKDIFEWTRAVSVTADGQKAVVLLSDRREMWDNLQAADIVDMLANDPDHIDMALANKYDRQWTLDVYKVDVGTGISTIDMHGDAQTASVVMDGDGHYFARVEQDGDLVNHLLIDNKDVLQWSVNGGSDLDIEGLAMGPDPALVIRRASDLGTLALFPWRPGAGYGAPLFADPTYDVDDAILDERNGRVIGFTYYDDMLRSRYFDPALQSIQSSLESAFPGQSVIILSRDDANSEFLVAADGPRNPYTIYLFTRANHQVNIVQEAYPLLKASDLGAVKPYPYKSRDGLDIRSYLTLPPGKPPSALPVVVMPHGGPEARDALDFDWWAQFLASRGYAVLQPNFRGSSGYGGRFIMAGDGEWAHKVQYDVQDGVAKLIADGIADPKRICIVGASYGGYMALAGATFSPDLYACAVSVAGVSDLSEFTYTGTTFESEGTTLWKRRIGSNVDKEKIKQDSPANFASQVKIPVLLIHSELDVTVPIRQSQIEERALKDAGKNVQLVVLPGDDHYLTFSQTRIRMLTEVEKFLAAHIGN